MRPFLYLSGADRVGGGLMLMLLLPRHWPLNNPDYQALPLW